GRIQLLGDISALRDQTGRPSQSCQIRQGQSAFARLSQQPERTPGKTGIKTNGRSDRNSKARAQIALAFSARSDIDGKAQRLVSGSFATLDQFLSDVAILEDVELKHLGTAAGGGHLLQ